MALAAALNLPAAFLVHADGGPLSNEMQRSGKPLEVTRVRLDCSSDDVEASVIRLGNCTRCLWILSLQEAVILAHMPPLEVGGTRKQDSHC